MAEAGWHTTWDAAAKESKSTGKPILMDFTGSDWCGWCIKLNDEVFKHDPFKTGVADALFARTCHGLAPPCGSAGCVDTAAMHSIWSDAHSFYCERFGGPNGGERSSRLAMLPLLRDIFGRLQAASQETSSERISVFSN